MEISVKSNFHLKFSFKSVLESSAQVTGLDQYVANLQNQMRRSLTQLETV